MILVVSFHNGLRSRKRRLLKDSNLHLGIDQGSSSSKALLINSAAELLWSDSVPVGTNLKSDGSVTQDAKELLGSLQSLITSAQKFTKNIKIHRIGLSCQRSAVVAWNRSSLKPESPVMTWRDTSLKAATDKLKSHSSKVHSKTGLPITVHYAAPKIAHLQKQFPSTESIVGTLDSFLSHSLCGALSTDDSMASRTMLYDLSSQQWDGELADMFGVEKERLIPIVGTVYQRDSISGILFTVSIGDSQAACFGLNTGKSLPVLSLGTVASLMVPTGESPQLAPGFLSNIFYTTAGQKQFQIEGTVNCCGATIDLIVKRKKLAESPAQIDGLCLKALARDGEQGAISYLPIGGTGAPEWLDGLPCAIEGWDGEDADSFVRAAMENLGCFISELILSFQSLTLQSFKQIVVTGGVSKSEFLLQFISDCAAIPLVKPDNDHGAAYGAALLTFNERNLSNFRENNTKSYEPKNSLAKIRFEKWRKLKAKVQRGDIEGCIIIKES